MCYASFLTCHTEVTMSGLVRFGVSPMGICLRGSMSLSGRRATPTGPRRSGPDTAGAHSKGMGGRRRGRRAITLIYDHHHRELLNKVTDLQHDYQRSIISTQHVHLEHNNCLEIVAVRGSPMRSAAYRTCKGDQGHKTLHTEHVQHRDRAGVRNGRLSFFRGPRGG